MRTAHHPRVQWVILTQYGPTSVVCQCQACGASSNAASPRDIEAFATQHAQHQSSPTHYGAGDLVAGATKAMGFKPCTPCEQRRRQLNGLLPRLWRR